ncbi:hypothetical protein DFR26_1952 [Paraperlucidibaca baekdonensis]|uniref:DUF1365 family protein n=1 Tax=Paraperlucidibaca baekdonensis TaxID=748120 RepID=A0A3E0H1A8_9GAMM|nr:DUF1365 domain-containing protein [Paraperlucidibaca baekdonensis]REH36814.1 hypothetical protein DFR26_1952 [Paraperlucidibaca baekdonensis]
MNKPWLYKGRVGHARLGEKQNAFVYNSFFICFPLSQRQQLASRLFSVNRWNLFSWHEKDHGDGVDAQQWIRTLFTKHGATAVDGEIYLQAMPRIFGYVFNPVSFWYGHDRQGQLRAVLCEVRNTFGEQHRYLLQAPDQAVITDATALHSEKVFHVSPFYPVSGEYRFRFTGSAQTRRVAIDYWQADVLALKTYVSGKACELTDQHILTTLMQLGWTTVMVVWRIHWQALRLWLKGVTFHRKPSPPSLETTR